MSIHIVRRTPVGARREYRIEAMPVDEFLAKDVPPRPMLLGQWLVDPSLAMIHAPRGVGKTYFSLEVGWAVATGGQFLMWSAPQAHEVLYVDGELPVQDLHARLKRMAERLPEGAPAPRLRLISPGLQDEQCMPDLGTKEGQEQITNALGKDTKLLILENISTLVRSGAENESRSWASIQQWLIWLRSRGVTVLLIHHSGKKGAQRGTSKREDTLDVVLHLRRPKDYRPSDGARFVVEFEKARFLYGEAVMPFECRLRPPRNPDDQRPILIRPAWDWSSHLSD